MGCDIHSFAERKINDKWERVEEAVFIEGKSPFGWRSYSMFGFLADVCNYSHCPTIVQPRGLPKDSEYLNSPSPYAYEKHPYTGELIPESERETNLQDNKNTDYHNRSWILLSELISYNYEQVFEDRRTMKQVSPMYFNGAYVVDEGQGVKITVREHLGESFFKDLEALKTLGDPKDVRIVFWFCS